MIELGVEPATLQDIINGRKTIEGRLRTAKTVTVRKGDVISFREDVWEDGRLATSDSSAVTATVTETKFYDSFAEMFADVDYRMVIPEATSSDDATARYQRFSTPAQEAEHGVVALRFTVNVARIY